MPNNIELRFTGNLAPDNRITARTLSHSLGHLQRAIDKIVIYETRGGIRKYSSLGNNQYELADLIVLPFEPGSIRIPLLNEASDFIATRLRGILEEPYRQAADDAGRDGRALYQQVDLARERARNQRVQHTQEELINNPVMQEREYIKAAVLADVNNLLNIVRSKSSTEEETVSLTVRDQERTGVYTFDKSISKSFNQIVRSRSLGPEVVYNGILDGLETTRNPGFPYSGKFIPEGSNQEMKIWIHSEAAAHALNEYNLTRASFRFWGSPIMVYGAFDPVRGDIVFLDFA